MESKLFQEYHNMPNNLVEGRANEWARIPGHCGFAKIAVDLARLEAQQPIIAS